MLVKNLITSQLYNHGYNGIDNIYDYWVTYREEIIQLLKKKKYKKQFAHLTAFEYKIRWATYYGLWFRFYIRMHLRSPREVIEFHKIPIKFGTVNVFLDDFIDDISAWVDKSELVDLRGLSLISYHFKHTTIQNVDFSYGALDSSTFDHVTFDNCRFDHTSFSSAKFTNCYFETSCFFNNNEFINAYIDGAFECDIINPVVKNPSFINQIGIKMKRKSSFHSYTKIISQTFIKNSIQR